MKSKTHLHQYLNLSIHCLLLNALELIFLSIPICKPLYPSTKTMCQDVTAQRELWSSAGGGGGLQCLQLK